MDSVTRLGKRYDAKVMRALMYMPAFPGASPEAAEALDAWMSELAARLNTDMPLSERYEVTCADPEIQPSTLRVLHRSHGIPSEREIPFELFAAAEFRQLHDTGLRLADLISPGALVRRGERERSVLSFEQAVNWLLDEAKRGQHIQRYKGLGEMNPAQLWETTMDAATRRLLRVTIEDVVGADEIFSILMGDQVEPRRDFIEKNALFVENLDV
jgi:DNA gyrase subunit B